MMQVTKVWWDGERLMAEPIDPTTIYQEPLQREPDFWEGYQPEPTKPAPVREDWGPGPHEFHSLPSQPAPVQEPVAQAWAEGYRAGIDDERTSEASIGIAGFDAKVEPARNNPYRTTPPAAQPAPVQESVAWQVMVEDEAMEEFSVKDAAHDWCVQQKLAGSPYSYWIRPLYTAQPAQEFVCSTGLCHYKATSEKRECMNCAAFGECNPNNDAGRCGYEPPAAQLQWIGLTDEDVKELCGQASNFGTSSWIRYIEAKLRSKNENNN